MRINQVRIDGSLPRPQPVRNMCVACGSIYMTTWLFDSGIRKWRIEPRCSPCRRKKGKGMYKEQVAKWQSKSENQFREKDGNGADCPKDFSTQWVHIKDLRVSPFQAPWRHDPDRKMISDLAANIREVGLLNPITCGRYNGVIYIANGHCRCAACRMLGWTHVHAHVVPIDTLGDLAILAAGDTTVTTKQSGADLLYLWAKTPSSMRAKVLAAMGSGIRRNIKSTIAILGEPRALSIADGKVDPSCSQTVDKAATVMGRLDAPPSKKRIYEWIVKHRLAHTRGFINKAMHRMARDKLGRRDAEQMAKLIREDKPPGKL